MTNHITINIYDSWNHEAKTFTVSSREEVYGIHDRLYDKHKFDVWEFITPKGRYQSQLTPYNPDQHFDYKQLDTLLS